MVTLGEDDLKHRLEASPWNHGQADAAVNWVKEAAAAFNVPMREGGAKHRYRTKRDIINDTMAIIFRRKRLEPGALEMSAISWLRADLFACDLCACVSSSLRFVISRS